MIPHATNFLRRALRMFFANPKLCSKSEKRRMPQRASRTMSRDHHSPMVSSERATGHALALKDLCRIAPRSLIARKSGCTIIPDSGILSAVASCNQTGRRRAARLIRLQEPKCNIRAEFKLRRGIHTNEKHRQNSGTLRTDEKKRVQEKFDTLRHRSYGGGCQLCRRAERSPGCPPPAS